MKVVVFLGPTLARERACRILPGALFLPPAQQADVLSAVGIYKPDVIGLIDGSFGQTLSVWHKEILFALAQGVQVLGAASMGALRAAELASFGMRGVGEVFRLFSSGELHDDDEVALVHASAEQGFRPLSEPMVNVRATLRTAREAGLLRRNDCERLIEVAKQLHFSRRTLPTILANAELSPAVVEEVRGWFQTRYVDVKAADAQLLLQAIRDVPLNGSTSTPVPRSRGFVSLYNEDRRIRHGSVDVPLRAIATYAALHAADFDELNFAALNRLLVQVLAELLHVQPDDTEIDAETQRFQRERDLVDSPQLDGWRRANDLSATELKALIRERAVCRRLQRWLLGGVPPGEQTRSLLDELRVGGRYAETAAATAGELALTQPVDAETDSLAELEEADIMDLVPAHQRATGWRLNAPLAEWAEEAGFSNLKDLAYELLRARRGRATASNPQPGGRTHGPIVI